MKVKTETIKIEIEMLPIEYEMEGSKKAVDLQEAIRGHGYIGTHYWLVSGPGKFHYLHTRICLTVTAPEKRS